MFAWLGQVLGGFLGKLWEPLIHWWAAYQQGRNAERAEQAQGRADMAERIAEAQSRVEPPVIDDHWLRDGSPSEAPDLHDPNDTPSPRG